MSTDARLVARRLAPGLMLGLLAVGLATAGCSVEPYCLDCIDDGIDAQRPDADDAGDAGAVDARSDAQDADLVDSFIETPDGCAPGAVELCNLFDDDCDENIDEGFDLETDELNCGGCGERCEFPHAFADCVGSICQLGSCDVGYYDENGDPMDGCEYRCAGTDPDDVRCDLRDNDCDGNTDEDVLLDSDPANCGSCGRTCRFAHAMGACAAGACVLGICDEGFENIDGTDANGCEYACLAATPPDEVCNIRDDDCDGTIDEGDPGAGATCGSDEGECAIGVEHCVGGALTCVGGASPDTETCNGLDDDCDASSDEGNPDAGRLCGTGTGTCAPGREVCTGGALVCTGAIGPSVETCDGRDEDCDGTIDDGDPGGGGACASDLGECAAGALHCRGGVLACEMAVGPSIEICDALDNDCDGVVDDGNPGGGGPCGNDVGTCSPGTRSCTGGALVCTGGTGPVAERCDALDNDCDGSVDEGNPGGGSACGVTTGECAAGAQQCTAGSLLCVGAIGPTTETCDAQDDDCDGRVDEGNPGGGAACGNDVGACVAGSRICTAGALVCTGGTGPGTESCNSIDDDCDGRVDELNPGGGGTCGIATGECAFGTRACTGGALVCTGGIGPTTETCDAQDDDCDGLTDEGNPGGGGTCGSDVGSCSPGARVCSGGALLCMGGTGPVAETCNSQDDDCDASVDELNPGGGGSCGISTGECAFGTNACTGGAIVCTGGTGPTAEVCDAQDDDCDGLIDEGNPGGGASCGSDIGRCTLGSRVCTAGALVCSGGTAPAAESCNALDDDCDSNVDEGNPGGGMSCGTPTGECASGTTVCASGSFTCTGAVGPAAEVCDTRDNDCDALTDEGFALATDVNNCGMCGRVCVVPNAIPRCSGGMCGVLACNTGFFDLDLSPANGCEYACSFAGGEACNGRDDDCDGVVDDGLTAPSMFCNPNGVCAGTAATCGGTSGWLCNYPAATYQTTETRCDMLDNDCDGMVDEPFPLRGMACNNGELGACRITGTYACNAMGTGVACSAPASGGGTAETCNGLDDDCDGVLDDGAPQLWVPFTSGGARWIMQYEASRPNATSSTAGTMSHRVCSEAGRIPWTQVTYAQAQTACATVGAALCTETEWQAACQSTTGTCRWSYASGCSTYSSTTCNGNDYDPVAGAPDTDVVLATGALPMCYSNWGGTAATRVFDMSGNVEEWAERRAVGVNPIRGGSTNDTAGGLECGFNFVVAGDTFNAPSVGFRCCRSTAP